MITNSDDTVVTSTNSISNNTINNESSRLVTKKMQKITTRIIKICITKKFMAIIKVKLFYN